MHLANFYIKIIKQGERKAGGTLSALGWERGRGERKREELFYCFRWQTHSFTVYLTPLGWNN